MSVSKNSLLFEKKVASDINELSTKIIAERPNTGTGFSDIHVRFDNKESWIEVKMNHSDNLSNPRVFFLENVWNSTYKTKAAEIAVELLNDSEETKNFIQNISEFSKIKHPEIPTTKTGLLRENAVPLKTMKEYFNQPNINRYILNEENFNIGEIVTFHYLYGKKEPAYYLQAGDDFYLISDMNPFNLNKNIPILSGYGNFKVRISTRSKFYEVQAEIKISKLIESDFSLLKETTKINPFKELL